MERSFTFKPARKTAVSTAMVSSLLLSSTGAFLCPTQAKADIEPMYVGAVCAVGLGYALFKGAQSALRLEDIDHYYLEDRLDIVAGNFSDDTRFFNWRLDKPRFGHDGMWRDARVVLKDKANVVRALEHDLLAGDVFDDTITAHGGIITPVVLDRVLTTLDDEIGELRNLMVELQALTSIYQEYDRVCGPDELNIDKNNPAAWKHTELDAVEQYMQEYAQQSSVDFLFSPNRPRASEIYWQLTRRIFRLIALKRIVQDWRIERIDQSYTNHASLPVVQFKQFVDELITDANRIRGARLTPVPDGFTQLSARLATLERARAIDCAHIRAAVNELNRLTAGNNPARTVIVGKLKALSTYVNGCIAQLNGW